MALFASHANGSQAAVLATLGPVSAAHPTVAPGQLWIATARPGPAGRQPMAVQSSTRQPSGQRT